ncbi:DHS-like NAD/FAD-binding domain-containing protein [Jackrogersella minutella]|nr:DHS-like NAD/FAD-binding domain-containing protein [Jackrogersella minutella]
MANTAPKIPAKEHQEAPKSVDRKAEALVKVIRKCKHLVVFTGAGISTSAEIPDFRGPKGVWTLRAQGKQATGAVNTLQAIPTPTHMALVELQNRGILKYLISQNCDGLHRKSGILPDKISELHGNNNRECCDGCGEEHIRDFRAVASYDKTVHDHRTGRECARCGGVLLDSIINFGEKLWAEPLQLARDQAQKADVCLVLGSSLTVSPANEMPETAGELMVRVMAKLDISIPQFILRRRLIVQMESTGDGQEQLRVYGVDVKLEYNRRVARSEPFIINFRGNLDPGTQLKLESELMGHYGEPDLDINYEYVDGGHGQLYLLEYNPETGEWNTAKQEGPERATLGPVLDDTLPSDIELTPVANGSPEVIVID